MQDDFAAFQDGQETYDQPIEKMNRYFESNNYKLPKCTCTAGISIFFAFELYVLHKLPKEFHENSARKWVIHFQNPAVQALWDQAHLKTS